jgi:hypothetical protein
VGAGKARVKHLHRGTSNTLLSSLSSSSAVSTPETSLSASVGNSPRIEGVAEK